MRIFTNGGIKMNRISSIAARIGIQENGPAHRFLTSEAARLMDPYVPFLNGPLKNNKRVAVSTITYVMPYAKKNYFTNRGKGMRGKLWDKRMMADKKYQLAASVQEYQRRHGG